MSLINQMLRDLDKRHGLAGSEALPDHVRPASRGTVPAPSRRHWGLAGLGVAGGLAGFALWRLLAPVAPPPSTPAQPPAVLPATAHPAPVVESASPEVPVLSAPLPRPSLKLSGLGSLSAPSARVAPAAAEPARVEKQVLIDDAGARAERQYREALAAMNKGRVREAMEMLYVVVREQPGHTPSWQVLVRLLIEHNRPDEAIRVLREATATHPSWPLMLQRARLETEYANDAQALQTLQAARALGEGHAEYHGLLANLLQRQKRHAEAAAAYRQALTLNPGEGRWWVGLGLCLEETGQDSEAASAWRQARQAGNLPAELRQFVEARLSGG
jgi:MSHA biogenesis protein MshN